MVVIYNDAWQDNVINCSTVASLVQQIRGTYDFKSPFKVARFITLINEEWSLNYETNAVGIMAIE